MANRKPLAGVRRHPHSTPGTSSRVVSAVLLALSLVALVLVWGVTGAAGGRLERDRMGSSTRRCATVLAQCEHGVLSGRGRV